MSDLHRAVEAEIQAFTPDRTPPLSALVARKRSRDRRRYAVAGTALSVLAVGGVAVGSTWLTGAPERLPTRQAPVASGGAEVAPGPGAEQAARLCAAAAESYGGAVVGAYPTTVQEVRDYMRLPPQPGYELAAPGPNEANPFPPSWSFLAPATLAAACYLDVELPTPGPPGNGADGRALVMATGGATSFLAASGPEDSITPAPLPAERKPTVTLPTSDWTPGGSADLALFGGVVSARPDGDTLCVVLEPLDARTTDIDFTPVVWPKGYTATAYPLEIRDPEGQVVAREGLPLSFGGGLAQVEPGTPCMFGRSDAAVVMQELPPA